MLSLQEGKIMQHATYEDATLVMRLYELRREEKLRKARDWFQREFKASSVREIEEKYPPGSEENAYMRMVASYWEMAASFLVQEIVHDELFFTSNGEMLAVWEKLKPVAEELRKAFGNPLVYKNLEKGAEKHRAWLQQNAPGAYEAMQARMKARR
jgi:hypothetical protein